MLKLRGSRPLHPSNFGETHEITSKNFGETKFCIIPRKRFGDFCIIPRKRFGDFCIFRRKRFGDFCKMPYFCIENINLECRNYGISTEDI